MRKRKRKLSPRQQQLYDQMIGVLPLVIEKCTTAAEAEQMESHVFRLRTEGLISDQQYCSYLQQIKNLYNKNNWA